MVLAVGFVLFELRRVGEELNRVALRDIPIREQISAINAAKLQQSANFERALRFANEARQGDESLLIPMKEARAEFNRQGELMDDLFGRVSELLRDRDEPHRSPEIKRDIARLVTKLQQTQGVYSDYRKHCELILSRLEQGNVRDAMIEVLSIAAKEEELRSALDGLTKEVTNITDGSANAARTFQQSAMGVGVSISFLALVLGTVLSALLTRSISVPLGKAVEVASQIAGGQKDIVVPTHYEGEVGRLLSVMNEMLQAVRDSESALKERADELARSNAELEQFAYIASHDLQEPLRMVASFTQLLAKRYEGKLGEDADEFIHFAVEGVERMKNLINDLLTFSRVGRGDTKKERVFLNRVYQMVIGNLTPVIQQTNARVTHDPLPDVSGIETELMQLFQNLFSNALKFRGGHRPEIHLGVIPYGDMWEFTVSDNGIGIDTQFHERVFKIFQRLHSVAQYPGTGIGLAICKKIVEHHGGTIWVESRSGGGSVFHFTLQAVS